MKLELELDCGKCQVAMPRLIPIAGEERHLPTAMKWSIILYCINSYCISRAPWRQPHRLGRPYVRYGQKNAAVAFLTSGSIDGCGCTSLDDAYRWSTTTTTVLRKSPPLLYCVRPDVWHRMSISIAVAADRISWLETTHLIPSFFLFQIFSTDILQRVQSKHLIRITWIASAV